jgi:hypothetical protein
MLSNRRRSGQKGYGSTELLFAIGTVSRLLSALEKIEVKANANDIVYRQKAVCNRENPVADRIAVSRKTDRRQQLSDKQPF